MTEDGKVISLFPKLAQADIERLLAFFERDDLRVKGIDRSSKQPYRAGCLPYLGLVSAGIFGFVGEGLGMTRQVAIGLALTAAILATLSLIRAFVALRRSRDLLWRDEGWHGMAWDDQFFSFRSLEWCLLVPWTEITDLKYFEGGEGRFLGDTLWIHLEDKTRALVLPKSEGGRFAGRPLSAWHEDVKGAWKDATGRVPSAS